MSTLAAGSLVAMLSTAEAEADDSALRELAKVVQGMK